MFGHNMTPTKERTSFKKKSFATIRKQGAIAHFDTELKGFFDRIQQERSSQHIALDPQAPELFHSQLVQRITEEPDEDRRQVILDTLAWVCYATEPLSPRALEVAVATLNWSDLSCPPSEESVWSLVSSGHGAIQVVNGINPQDDRVKLSHESLHKILISAPGRLIGPKDMIRQFDLGQAWAMHALLGVGCLKYLMLDSDCTSREYVHQLQSKDFRSYAARNFDLHLYHYRALIGQELRPLRNFLTRDDSLLNWFFNFRTCDHFIRVFGKQDLNQDPVTAAEVVCATKLYQIERARDCWMKNGPGKYGLHAALLCGANDNAVDIIRSGCDVNALDRRGFSPLVYAAESGDLSMVKLLLEAGADPHVHGEKWRSALAAAHDRMSTQVNELLSQHGGDLQAKDRRQRSALIDACKRGEEDMVRMLVRNGADVNAREDQDGITPLQAAVGTTAGHEEIIKYLISRGAHVDATGSSGTALYQACHQDFEKLVRLLLNQGADVNGVGGLYGFPLQAAAFRGSQAIVKRLLDAGADVHARGGVWGHSLFAAAFSGAKEIIPILLSQGVDINEPSSDLGNAFCIACRQGNIRLVRSLICAGADVHRGVNVKTGGWVFSNSLEAALQGQHRFARKDTKEWKRYDEVIGLLRSIIRSEDWVVVDSAVNLPVR